jgi:hypothetical protein
MLTSIEEQDILDEGLAKGAEEYLIKSNINPETLIDIAHKYIELSDTIRLS